MKSTHKKVHLDYKEVHHGGHGIKPHEEGVRKYGDVKFAEPAQGKFPIDTDAHVRAAEGYKRFATPEGKAKIDAAARARGIGNH